MDKVAAQGAIFQVQTEGAMGGGVHGLDELRKPGYLLSQAELSTDTVLGWLGHLEVESWNSSITFWDEKMITSQAQV